MSYNFSTTPDCGDCGNCGNCGTCCDYSITQDREIYGGLTPDCGGCGDCPICCEPAGNRTEFAIEDLIYAISTHVETQEEGGGGDKDIL